jgi:hypothetical protein
MDVLVLLLAALLLSLLLLGLWRTLEQAWATRVRRKRAAAARRGEVSARALLCRLGYAIEVEQPAQPWPVVAGEYSFEVVLRADYLVSWRGQRYVAEVKTGDLVASLRHGPTRRQLLEYQLAYRAQGVLLVDVLGASVLRVQFPATAASSARLAGFTSE